MPVSSTTVSAQPGCDEPSSFEKTNKDGTRTWTPRLSPWASALELTPGPLRQSVASPCDPAGLDPVSLSVADADAQRTTVSSKCAKRLPISTRLLNIARADRPAPSGRGVPPTHIHIGTDYGGGPSHIRRIGQRPRTSASAELGAEGAECRPKPRLERPFSEGCSNELRPSGGPLHRPSYTTIPEHVLLR